MTWSWKPAPPRVQPDQSPQPLFATPAGSARQSHKRSAERSRYSVAQLQQSASFWIHDDGSSNHGDGRRHVFGEHCTPMGRTLTRRKFVIVGGIALILVIVAAVVGGIMGSRAAAGGVSDSESPGPDGPGAGAGELAEAFVNNGSQLTTWFATKPPVAGDERSLMSQFLIFQDAAGDLVVSEWYRDKLESYRLDQRVANLPKPVLGSQIRVVSFGKGDDLHVFYLDDKQLLRHLVRDTAQDSKVRWKLDQAFAAGGAQQHVASGLLLSASLFPSIDNGPSDGLLGVVYWNGAEKNTFTLMTTPNSDASSGWTSMEVPIDSDPEQEPRDLQAGSTGVVMLPLAVKVVDGDTPNGKLEPGARIILDLSNKKHPASLAFVDCVIGRPDIKKRCWPVTNITWHDETTHNRLLSAPKPLQISRIDISKDQWGMPGSYLLGTLDGAGNYMESFWSGINCTGSQVLSWADMLGAPSPMTFDKSNLTSPENNKHSFSSFDDTKEGLIFAAPNGTLLEVGRECGWWIGPCGQTKVWSLVGSLHAMVAKSKKL